MKIDWKRKLTSRKFWAAVIGFVSQMMVGLGADSGTVTQTVAVITAGATLIAYMLAESFTDSSHADTNNDVAAIGFDMGDERDGDELK